MKHRLAIILATGLGIVAVACSRPSDSTSKSSQGDRDIRLIEEPAAPTTVSNLEAGRVTPPVALPEARRPAPSRAAAPSPSPVHDHAALMAAVQPESTLQVVSRTELPAPAPLVDVPAASPLGPASMGSSEAGMGETGAAAGGSRGPMILIRGGMGTDRDDCKIHGMSGGIAINRMAPSFGPRASGGSARPMGGGIRIR